MRRYHGELRRLRQASNAHRRSMHDWMRQPVHRAGQSWRRRVRRVRDHDPARSRRWIAGGIAPSATGKGRMDGRISQASRREKALVGGKGLAALLRKWRSDKMLLQGGKPEFSLR